MGVTLKKKTTVQLAVDTDTTAGEQIVAQDVIDEFLALDAKIEKHNAKIEADIKRHGEIKKQIVALVDEVIAAEEKVTLMGSTNQRGIEVSAKPETTNLPEMVEVKKALGNDLFLQIAKVGITDLKAYLPKPKYDALVTITRDGTRRIKKIG